MDGDHGQRSRTEEGFYGIHITKAAHSDQSDNLTSHASLECVPSNNTAINFWQLSYTNVVPFATPYPRWWTIVTGCHHDTIRRPLRHFETDHKRNGYVAEMTWLSWGYRRPSVAFNQYTQKAPNSSNCTHRGVDSSISHGLHARFFRSLVQKEVEIVQVVVINGLAPPPKDTTMMDRKR